MKIAALAFGLLAMRSILNRFAGFFDLPGDNFDTCGDSFAILGIVDADTFVFVRPVFGKAREEIVAGDNQDTCIF